jgi:hypothetical protein
LGVECRKRLIHKEHSWLHRESASELHTLSHPAGELVHVGLAEPRQVYQPDVAISELLAVHALLAGHLQAQLHVCPHVKPWEQRRLLENDHAVCARLGDRASIEKRDAAVGVIEPGDDVEQSGFTAAGWPHDADKFPSFDVKGYVL